MRTRPPEHLESPADHLRAEQVTGVSTHLCDGATDDFLARVIAKLMPPVPSSSGVSFTNEYWCTPPRASFLPRGAVAAIARPLCSRGAPRMLTQA